MVIEQFVKIKKDADNYRKQKKGVKNVNIGFYGLGSIAEKALNFLAHTGNGYFSPPINNIYVYGREKDRERQKRLQQQFEEIFSDTSHPMKFIPRETKELDCDLEEISLLLFTASATKKGETDREKMVKSNISVVKEFSEYFNKNSQNFRGVINFVSNLPEALAHYSQLELNLNDARQVTAHIPLDMRRYERLIDIMLENDSPKDLDLALTGYHDRPWPVFNHSLIFKGWHKDSTPLYQDIGKIIENYESQESLASILENYALGQANLFKDENKLANNYNKKIPSREGPTSSPTGRAIFDFIKAFVNDDKTTCSVPYKIKGENYFVQMPVTFEDNYPKIDEEKYSNFTDKDHEALEKRILGAKEEKKFLKKVIENSIGRRQFFVPEDYQNIAEVFDWKNPYPKTEFVDTDLKEEKTRVRENKISDLKVYAIWTARKIGCWNSKGELKQEKEIKTRGKPTTPTSIYKKNGEDFYLFVGHKAGINMYDKDLNELKNFNLNNHDKHKGQIRSIITLDDLVLGSHFLPEQNVSNDLNGIYAASLEEKNKGKIMDKIYNGLSGSMSEFKEWVVFTSGPNLFCMNPKNKKEGVGHLLSINPKHNFTITYSQNDFLLAGDSFGRLYVFDKSLNFLRNEQMTEVERLTSLYFTYNDSIPLTIVGSSGGKIQGFDINKNETLFNYDLSMDVSRPEIRSIKSLDEENINISTSKYLFSVPIDELIRSNGNSRQLFLKAKGYENVESSIFGMEVSYK